ncbi:AAA family ATPase [Rhizobium sp. Leaf384]|uniref:ATP-binding protein n=1 Tax=unclassified Rhizobium TaxID=2613769 RepID=UPI0007147460|nr:MULTISPECIES: ATP-binding protein [unclassified Rhizobium]KQS74417.1 AAA family ATPase [Rhizobium sp. Leaf383]KQS80156.1 AAA family ATPase [Rhizobium sp. Leaf384]
MSEATLERLMEEVRRLSAAVERIAGPAPAVNTIDAAECFVWAPLRAYLQPVARPNRIDLSLIQSVDHVRDILLDNTLRFAGGYPANNVLLWGARGMGKSSLVKSVHAAVIQRTGVPLKLVEVHREDIATLPQLMDILKAAPVPFIVFCDDLSFDHDDTSYKSLKAVLDGGIEGRPDNVLLYATSNRRHLLPRDMMENERSTAINPSEAVEEKVSLSDRFGLWLGFYKCSQDDYLGMIDAYAEHFAIPVSKETLHAQALEWSTTRGGRSGRVAWQFIQDLAGRTRTRIADAGERGADA